MSLGFYWDPILSTHLHTHTCLFGIEDEEEESSRELIQILSDLCGIHVLYVVYQGQFRLKIVLDVVLLYQMSSINMENSVGF